MENEICWSQQHSFDGEDKATDPLSTSDVMNWLVENGVGCGCEYKNGEGFELWVALGESQLDSGARYTSPTPFARLNWQASMWLIETARITHPDTVFTKIQE